MKNHVIKTSLIIAALVLTGCTSNVTESKTESVQQVSYTKDSILDLITGIEDRYVLLNSENIDFMTNVSYVGDEIKSISVDAKDVDYNTPGTYSILYTIILSKDTDAINLESGNSYTKEVKVHIVTEEDIVTLIEDGKEVWTSNNQKVVLDIKNSEDKNSQEITESKNENNGNSTNKPDAQPNDNSSKPEKPSDDKEQSASGSSGGNNSNGVGNGTANTKPTLNETKETEKDDPETEPPKKETSSESFEGDTTEPDDNKVWHEPVYIDVWVVDKEAYYETISKPVYDVVVYAVCPQCGRLPLGTDPNTHISQTGHGSWHTQTEQTLVGYEDETIYHEEVGHWEKELISAGYWE